MTTCDWAAGAPAGAPPVYGWAAAGGTKAHSNAPVPMPGVLPRHGDRLQHAALSWARQVCPVDAATGGASAGSGRTVRVVSALSGLSASDWGSAGAGAGATPLSTACPVAAVGLTNGAPAVGGAEGRGLASAVAIGSGDGSWAGDETLTGPADGGLTEALGRTAGSAGVLATGILATGGVGTVGLTGARLGAGLVGTEGLGAALVGTEGLGAALVEADGWGAALVEVLGFGAVLLVGFGLGTVLVRGLGNVILMGDGRGTSSFVASVAVGFSLGAGR
ncbi:hypothetical protein AB0B45_10890 [Nonomuraea sp. NPDC049152]|uniref:hypothetical protein n=1 Tax=Nonomuraea sp. NPDC049152 TaxID=3154350 RepID=UPI003401863F